MRINTRRCRSRSAELVATPPGCVSRPLCWQRRPADEDRVARRLVVRSVDAAAGVGFPSWSRWARDPRCGRDLHGCCCRAFSASKIIVICSPRVRIRPWTVPARLFRVSVKAQSSLRTAYVLVGGVGSASRMLSLLVGSPSTSAQPYQPPGSHHRNPVPPRQQHDSLPRGIPHFRCGWGDDFASLETLVRCLLHVVASTGLMGVS
jgi:hypothetical protein